MHAEDEIMKDPRTLEGLSEQFALEVVPWYYRNNRLGTPCPSNINTDTEKKVRQGDDLFMAALWRKHLIVAYSREGYKQKTWLMPAGWEGISYVSISTISVNAPQELERKEVIDGKITLSLAPGQGVSIVPIKGTIGKPLTPHGKPN